MGQLIKTYNNQIFRLIFYRVNNWNDAQDLAQETFLKAFKNINSLKKTEKFKSWLFSIALNLVTDFYRKKKFLSFFGLSDNLENVIEYEPSSENKPDLVKIKEFEEKVEQNYTKFLSKNEKQIFMLKYIDDLTINEIAQILNKNISTVKTHLYRSIKKIKIHGEVSDER